MPVNRCDIIQHLERNGFFLGREGGSHSIYSDGHGKTIPVKRHSSFDRITANAICKQAGVTPIF